MNLTNGTGLGTYEILTPLWGAAWARCAVPATRA